MDKELEPEEHGPEVRPASNEVQDLLDRLAQALTTGDGRAVAQLWAAPALVVHDEAVVAVGSLDEIAAFFGGVKEQYMARGIVDTHGDIIRLAWMTDRIVMVDVRWPYHDASGHEVGYELSTYTLRRDDAGALKVQAVVLRGASQAH